MLNSTQRRDGFEEHIRELLVELGHECLQLRQVGGGQVSRAFRGLQLRSGLENLPKRNDKLTFQGKEVGYITSAIHSPRFGLPIALGIVRKECNSVGSQLTVLTSGTEVPAVISRLPF